MPEWNGVASAGAVVALRGGRRLARHAGRRRPRDRRLLPADGRGRGRVDAATPVSGRGRVLRGDGGGRPRARRRRAEELHGRRGRARLRRLPLRPVRRVAHGPDRRRPSRADTHRRRERGCGKAPRTLGRNERRPDRSGLAGRSQLAAIRAAVPSIERVVVSSRPSRTPNSARASPSCTADSPGTSVMSATTRESQSRSAGSRSTNTATRPISSAVTTKTTAAAGLNARYSLH